MAEFLLVIDGVLDREGGYVNDPSDRGGETKYGISQRAYPAMDIKSLTKQDAADIYAEDYWGPVHGDQIVSQVLANVVFDFAVNAGTKKAIRLLQQISNVTIDGWIGPITIDAVNSMDGEKTAMQYTLQRVEFYCGLASRRSSQKKFLVGWISRALNALYD